MKKLIIIAIAIAALATGSVGFSNPSRDELLELNDQIVAKKQQIKELQDKIKASESNIEALQQTENTLENEIAILDNQLTKIDLDIQETQAQIEEIALELKQLDTEISDTNERVENDRDMLATLIRKIDREDERTNLETLFLADNLSEIFNRAKFLQDVQGDMLTTVKRLQEEKAGLEQKKTVRLIKNEELRKSKDNLKIEEIKLSDNRTSKELLIDQTRNSEYKYRDLLTGLRNEASSVSNDMATLEEQARAKLLANDRFPTGDVILSWPVPSHRVTAGFHDPDYSFRRVMEHPAIDIGSTPQGTPVRAAAPGYILKAKDAGYGYSYVIILHANGISTVYGHLSKIYVEDDTYIERGDTIGLSGGMPGTRGAGRMTTGPHLHFEVRVDGIPVDPMDYLVD